MTSIKLTLTGAHALAEVNGVLTSGMVGIPVTIEYDDAWQGLTKNLVCRCGRPHYPPDKASTWIIPEIGTSAAVAPEAMQPDMYLYLGVEGYSSDGSLVMPTNWVECGIILPGAQTVAARSAEPTQPIWARLKSDIAQLKENTVTGNQVTATIKAYLQDNPPDLSDITRKLDSAVLCTTQELTAAQQTQVRTNIGVPEDIPDYVKAEAERVAAVVHSRQHADTISFIACADLHYSDPGNAVPHPHAAYHQAAMAHMGQAMKLIRERVHIDFAAMLGDMFWDSSETPAEAQAAVRFVNSCLYDSTAGIPQFRTRGNHDNGSGIGANFSVSRIFSNIGAFNNGAAYGHRSAGYCYRDFEEQKLRVICLNSSETGGCLFSADQVTWLASVLDLSEKGSGWRSLILSHHPLDWGLSGGASPIATVNHAEGIICSIHGHIHNFKVDTITGTSVPRISVPNAGYGRENQYGTTYGVNWGEDTTYSKVPGTAADTSFCVFTIDLAEQVIYADHYGAGYSRVIAYHTHYSITNTLTNVTTSNSQTSVGAGKAYAAVLTADDGYSIDSVSVTMGGTDITSSAYSDGQIAITAVTGDIVITAAAGEIPVEEITYTNLVPTATAAWNGTEIYNGIGYKDGAYVSTDSFGSAEGYVAVGFLALNNTDVIYTKGAEIVSEDKVRLYVTSITGGVKYACKSPSLSGGYFADTAGTQRFTIEQLGDLYYRLTPVQSANDASMYYRISLKGTGANLVITHNEPIE